MAKAVLVMDMPESCIDCQLVDSEDEICLGVVTNDMLASEVGKYYCGDYYRHSKPDWCPLVELPERKDPHSDLIGNTGIDSVRYAKAYGFNECLDVLEGKEEGKENE